MNQTLFWERAHFSVSITPAEAYLDKIQSYQGKHWRIYVETQLLLVHQWKYLKDIWIAWPGSDTILDSDRKILGQKYSSHRLNKRNKRRIIEEQYGKSSIYDYLHYGWIYNTTSMNNSNTYLGSWIYQPILTLELTRSGKVSFIAN